MVKILAGLGSPVSFSSPLLFSLVGADRSTNLSCYHAPTAPSSISITPVKQAKGGRNGGIGAITVLAIENTGHGVQGVAGFRRVLRPHLFYLALAYLALVDR